MRDQTIWYDENTDVLKLTPHTPGAHDFLKLLSEHPKVRDSEFSDGFIFMAGEPAKIQTPKDMCMYGVMAGLVANRLTVKFELTEKIKELHA